MLDTKITVIICCYNSISRIYKTLEHLSKQEVEENIKWEIIIVDNNSNDGTSEYISEIWSNLGNPVTLRIVNEFNQGLSNARLKGVKESKGEIIIFCDDDNWLTSNYIAEASIIMSKNCKIGALGGESIAVTDSIFPNWFDEYKTGYAVGEQHNKTGYLPKFKLLFGAGLVIRKKIIKDAYSDFPSLLSDRKGRELSSGGDSEICLRLMLMNYKLYYNNNLKFYHFIPKYRLTEKYRDNLWAGLESPQLVLNDYIFVISFINNINGFFVKLLISSIIKYIISLIMPRTRWDKKEQIYKIVYLTGISIENDNNIYKILKMARKLRYYMIK